MHHGSNPEYIDKNLGGITMLYDHLFGTYAKEKAPVVYGITHNIHTHHPATIIFHEFLHIGKAVPRIKGIKAKLLYLFSPPGDKTSLKSAGASQVHDATSYTTNLIKYETSMD